MKNKNNHILLVQNETPGEKLKQSVGEIDYQLVPATFLNFREVYQYGKATSKDFTFCLAIIDDELDELTMTDRAGISGCQLVCEHLRLIESYGNPIVILAHQAALKDLDLLKMKADVKIAKPLTVEKIQDIFVQLTTASKLHNMVQGETN